MADRPYSRHYHELVDDPKFAEVYPDDHHYATWSRLLMVADQAWPASAHLPASARRASVSKLAAVGLIDLLPDGRFRMHGLQKEREVREAHARKAAAARWNARSTAPSNAGAVGHDMPRRDETSKDETRRADDDGRADLDAFLAVRFRPPTPAQRELMDAYVRVFDVTGPQRAADLIYRHPDDPIGALKADLTAFRQERAAEARQAERPTPVRRRKPSTLTGIDAELSRLFGDRYRSEEHERGEHAEPVDGCPKCQEGAA